MKNLYLPLAIVIAAAVIGGAIFYNKARQNGESGQKEEIKKEFNIEEKHTWGNPDAPITIVEFSDFQCPYCQSFHPTVKQIIADYPDQVRWAYKHFPLDRIHQNARPSAEASECAAEQGKFWEFSDGLFEKQSQLGENLYRELANDLGLNMEQFTACLASEKYKEHVQTDLEEGIRVGVRGTPASFVNGELISGAVSYDSLKTAIERALAK